MSKARNPRSHSIKKTVGIIIHFLYVWCIYFYRHYHSVEEKKWINKNTHLKIPFTRVRTYFWTDKNLHRSFHVLWRPFRSHDEHFLSSPDRSGRVGIIKTESVRTRIRLFHISHNAPYLPPKFCISIVFNFSCDGCETQEKWKTKVMQNLWCK